MVRKAPKNDTAEQESREAAADAGVPAFLKKGTWGKNKPAEAGEQSAGESSPPAEGPGATSSQTEAPAGAAEQASDPAPPPTPAETPRAEAEPATGAKKSKKGGGVGHNSRNALVSFVERIERMDEERRAAVEDIKEIYAEAKAHGYDAAILRKVMARRRMDPDKLAEIESLIDTYEAAIREG